MSAWGRRVCCACGNDLDSDEFSRNQWAKGVGISRCSDCVKEGITEETKGFRSSGRENTASRVNVDLNDIFAEGTFKYCAEGRYAGGLRTGQKCVVKWFKEDNDFHGDLFERDLEAVQHTLRIITQWNQAALTPDVRMRINIPEIWTIQGQKSLLEPFIEDFTKFNSNTGWYAKGARNGMYEVLQALSHYSYHISSGQFLICDLQGGINRNVVTLTDPAVMSRKQKFGPADLGPRGISSFFYFHR